MAEQGSAARPAREVGPIKKGIGEIINHVQALSTQVARRAYEIFEESGRKVGLDLAHWLQAEAELLHPIHLKISEANDSIIVRAEVPGFAASELDVRVEPRRMAISGKREKGEGAEERQQVNVERCSDRILRVVDLPAEVDPDKTVATLKDGILKLELPKTSIAKRVPIKTV